MRLFSPPFTLFGRAFVDGAIRDDISISVHEGRIVTEGPMAELRAGSETLEDVFVRVVGAERAFERLEWL